MTIDFDAQHIPKWEGFFTWLGGFGFFGAIFTIASLRDPVAMNPALNREEAGHIVGSVKIEPESAGGGDEEDEEDDDDEDE